MTNETRLRAAAEAAFAAFNTAEITDAQAMVLADLGAALEASAPDAKEAALSVRPDEEGSR